MSAGQLGMEAPGPGARCPVQEQRARWERKRACTARELLETERRYQEQLGLVATVGAPRALSNGAGSPGCGGKGLCEVGDPEDRGLALSSCIWGAGQTSADSSFSYYSSKWPWRCLFPQTICPCALSAVLRGHSESQGHPAATGAPGPVWALGAHLRRQPVSGRGAGRGRREGASERASLGFWRCSGRPGFLFRVCQ